MTLGTTGGAFPTVGAEGFADRGGAMLGTAEGAFPAVGAEGFADRVDAMLGTTEGAFPAVGVEGFADRVDAMLSLIANPGTGAVVGREVCVVVAGVADTSPMLFILMLRLIKTGESPGSAGSGETGSTDLYVQAPAARRKAQMPTTVQSKRGDIIV